MSKMVKTMWEDHLEEKNVDIKKVIKTNIRQHAPDAVFAFWSLSDWSNFKTYTRIIDKNKYPYERYFYSAVTLIKQKVWSEALVQIANARKHLESQVSSLLQESYIRAYGKI